MAASKPEDINKMIEEITVKNNNVLRYPAGRSFSRYVVKEDGIQEEWDELDQNGEVLHTIGKMVGKMVMPKELFIKAYNTYIKNEGDTDGN